MKYERIRSGKFISRPNRFIANVEIAGEEGKIEKVHVKNTGRCSELFLNGARIILEESNNPNRKTKYDLVAVYKEDLGWVNVDSQAPNKVVREWLESFPDSIINTIKPEYTYGNSRIDFYIESGDEKILMEVKGVTLERKKIGYFPDAPTERGVKHLDELRKAVSEGYKCYIAFVIQMEGVDEVYPNYETHMEFKTALENAVNVGVGVLYLGCKVSEGEMAIDRVKGDSFMKQE